MDHVQITKEFFRNSLASCYLQADENESMAKYHNDQACAFQSLLFRFGVSERDVWEIKQLAKKDVAPVNS